MLLNNTACMKLSLSGAPGWLWAGSGIGPFGGAPAAGGYGPAGSRMGRRTGTGAAQ